MSYNTPPRPPAPVLSSHDRFLAAIVAHCVNEIAVNTVHLNTADKNRALLALRSMINDTLEALESNTDAEPT